jgi:hypothetical protein
LAEAEVLKTCGESHENEVFLGSPFIQQHQHQEEKEEREERAKTRQSNVDDWNECWK